MNNHYNALYFNIKITRPTPEDVFGMATVFYEVAVATFPNKEYGITIDGIKDLYCDTLSEESLNEQIRELEGLSHNQVIFIAKAGARLVGVIRVEQQSERAHLRSVYILPEYQRSGIGRRLWGAAKERLAGDMDVSVYVAVYNTNAIEFYKKLGFEETSAIWNDEELQMRNGAVIPLTELMLRRK